MQKFKPYTRTLADIGPILVRHVFLLVNGIIGTVVILLFIFGNREAAIFLGIITLFNMLLGIIQDTRARIALETLQMITALRVIRIDENESETSVLAEEIVKGDRIKLKLGDQAPADGILLSANGLEVSEALLTGESDSFPRNEGAELRAGDIITAGNGILEVRTNFNESGMAQMTAEAKKYAAKPSPIQLAIEHIIAYSGYVLLASLTFLIIRGLMVHEPHLTMVLHAGALASIIVPQGLVVITTLLFAFGASSYSSRHVLFQEINATEKLGRIKNLCMDKTGTLTENSLVVEKMEIPEGGSIENSAMLTHCYIQGTGDSSQTIVAVSNYLQTTKNTNEATEQIIGTLPFSSWRQYGAVGLEGKEGKHIILVGAPDIFLPHLSNQKEKEWLTKLIATHAHQGNRMLAVTHTEGAELPRELGDAALSIVTVFIFHSELREGIRDAIAFFQDRGVRIRIISGDNAETVQAVACRAGINDTETIVTGTEMKEWKAAEFDRMVRAHTIFARILPEQKVQIIESFKKDGFTAMVGDGANDALAIKKADLGIAMFDGAPATRRLAGVILMNNSFTALPGGVTLADNFIRNIEVFAGIFINQSILGFFVFVLLSIFGSTLPLTPLNITLINYFTVGIPGMLLGYWAIRPSGINLPANSESFLARVIPFALAAGTIEAISTAIIFAWSPPSLALALSNTLVGLAFIVNGFFFFMLAPRVYRGNITNTERFHILLLGLVELALLFIILRIPLLVLFFNVTMPLPKPIEVLPTLMILGCSGVFLFVLAKTCFLKQEKGKSLEILRK